MPEMLAMLDAAIAEVGQRVRESSRSSRQVNCTPLEAGSDKALKPQAIPVLPVLPVKNDAVCGGTKGVSKKTLGASKSGDVAPEESILKSTGSTGTTGSIQDSCELGKH